MMIVKLTIILQAVELLAPDLFLVVSMPNGKNIFN